MKIYFAGTHPPSEAGRLENTMDKLGARNRRLRHYDFEGFEQAAFAARVEIEEKKGGTGKIIIPKGEINPEVKKVTSRIFVRDQKVKEFVMGRANGICDLCGNGYSHIRRRGKPALDAAHIDSLCSGGSDTVDKARALCPECHDFFDNNIEENKVIDCRNYLLGQYQ